LHTRRYAGRARRLPVSRTDAQDWTNARLCSLVSGIMRRCRRPVGPARAHQTH